MMMEKFEKFIYGNRLILGTSFRSKWANRNFLDESRDDEE